MEIKSKAGSHVAWCQIERVETIFKDTLNGPVERVELKLHFRVIQQRNEGCTGVFEASYIRNYMGKESVSLSGTGRVNGGYITTNGFEGHRLGTYLMSEVVRWAKQWPEANVETIKLGAEQAWPENLERRANFYERINIKFIYTDEEKHCGHSMPMLVKDLTIAEKELWRKQIFAVDLVDRFIDQVRQIKVLEINNEIYRDQIHKRNAEMTRPISKAEKIIRIIFNL